MDQLAAHARAQQIFQDMLANVAAEQWDAPTPCGDWTVAELVDHIVGGNAWVQGLAGRQPVAVPEDDRAAAVAASAQGAHAVFAADDGLTRMFDLPFGTMPGAAFVGIRTSDVLMHAWDLAKATGQSTHLDDELAGEALAAARARLLPQMRGDGKPFGPEQPCPDGRPVSDQLAAFLGRRVD